MNIRATRRFGLRGILLSSALVMFSGAGTAAEIPICTPTGPALQTCADSGLAVSAVPDGTSATWDAEFESGQFLQLPNSASTLTLSVGFEGTDPDPNNPFPVFDGSVFFEDLGAIPADLYLTDANGDEITGLSPASLVIVGSGFSRTWSVGLAGLAIYDFHARCDSCAANAEEFQIILTSYSFTVTASDDDDPFTIGSTTVPAPASLALLGLGLVAVGGWSRRRHAA